MLNRKIFAAIMAVCVIFGMTSCAKSSVPTEQAAQNSEIETYSQAVQSNTEILMPDGWTSENFYNFFVINGKTLTLPTTLNELMEFDDKFTYEVVLYVDENSIDYKDKKGFGVNIFYNDKKRRKSNA